MALVGTTCYAQSMRYHILESGRYARKVAVSNGARVIGVVDIAKHEFLGWQVANRAPATSADFEALKFHAGLVAFGTENETVVFTDGSTLPQ